ncbi:MAG: S-layer homology domain-containing protein, partial [Defluviitaleaceae bacterium]|nr:S-layer homology domain-containing protein [Defluviitaleaceae bacterium]
NGGDPGGAAPAAPPANGAAANGGDTADGLITTDRADNTYVGRSQASRLITQLQYTDMPDNTAIRDAIVRSGALEIIRPTAATFRPSAAVTREEAIMYAMRLAGHSDAAMAHAATLDLPENTPLGVAWSLAYIQYAATIGIITPDDFDAALAEVQAQFAVEAAAEDGLPVATLPGTTVAEIVAPLFQRTEPATREEIASYIVGAMQHAQGDVFANNAAGRNLQSFTDWQSISPEHAPAVELLLRNNVMNGQSATQFGPSGTVQRQHMAGIIRNLDGLHYGLLGLVRRTGTVSDLTNEQFTETGAGVLWRHVSVRRADGGVDQLQFELRGDPSPQAAGSLDAVVLRDGQVMGLYGLEINDQIEYIIHPEDGTVWYVLVTSQVEEQIFRGRLEIINMDEGTMTFRNVEGTVFTFPMSDGLYGIGPDDEPFIRMPRNIIEHADALPRGTFYDVSLVGNVIVAIEFVGDPILVPEHRGLVIDNNPLFGYITILDANREEQSFTYNPAQLVVHRRQFFDARDTIGGIHEMFPSVRSHPRTVDAEDVIPGDIVVFRVADDDPFRIIELSASENIISRYGRVLEIRDHGGYFDMLLEFESGQSAWYTFVDGILVLENGRPVNANRIQLGDWARIIVNQAIVAPGVMMESVREIALDGGGHHINSVITGRLAGFNAAQNTLQIEHARRLTPAGWSNHSPLASFNIGGNNVRYFHDGRQVTLAHINRYLQRSDAIVYLALENHFAGERAIMVSVRTGRDELFRAGEVLHAANNAFSMLEIPGDIATDAGTIVVRNGRLVEQQHIFAPDWARVAMNGPSTAAVVDIGSRPDTSGVQIVRARVARVWPFEGFRAETISLFDGFRWHFTPIAREFTIDHDTLFIGPGGVTSIDNFLGYTTDTVIGDVFNVVVEGGRAVRVIDAPFTQPIPPVATAPGHLTVRGVIYSTSGGVHQLRDLTVYNPRTGEWSPVSAVNSTGVVTTHPNTIVVDRNEVIAANRLQVGQQITAFSSVGRDMVDHEPGMEISAFIVQVEN